MKREKIGSKALLDWDAGFRVLQGGGQKVTLERIRFDGLTEFLRHVEGRAQEICTLRDSKGQIVNMLLDDGERMDNGAGVTYAETRHLAHKGWKEGLKQARSIVKGMINAAPQSNAIRNLLTYCAFGGIPDVGAYLSSEPEHFLHIEPVMREGIGRVARFRVCISAGNISPEALLVRGLILTGALDALEAQGMMVELDLVCPLIYVDTSHMIQIEIPLKQAGKIGDNNRIVFCIAHPAFTRRYVNREAQFYTKSRTEMGRMWCDQLARKEDVVINPFLAPPYALNYWTPQKAADFVTKKIEDHFRIF